MYSKKAFEFSFSWIFAIVIGATLIFLAIYLVSQLINAESYRADTTAAAKLSVVFEPLETGSSVVFTYPPTIELSEETQIFNSCDDDGSFGENQISLATKSGLGGKFREPGAPISITNKYIFSSRVQEGKKVNLMSKSFKAPFKIADLIILFDQEEYFFSEPIPSFLKNEMPTSTGGSSVGKTVVCFSTQAISNPNCDIRVRGCSSSDLNCKYDFEYGQVSKDGKILYFYKDLIYAAVFSDKDIYDCNVKRLMKRLRKECQMYMDEAKFLSDKCGTANPTSFLNLIGAAREIELQTHPFSSPDSFIARVKELDQQNCAAECNLWKNADCTKF